MLSVHGLHGLWMGSDCQELQCVSCCVGLLARLLCLNHSPKQLTRRREAVAGEAGDSLQTQCGPFRLTPPVFAHHCEMRDVGSGSTCRVRADLQESQSNCCKTKETAALSQRDVNSWEEPCSSGRQSRQGAACHSFNRCFTRLGCRNLSSFVSVP